MITWPKANNNVVIALLMAVTGVLCLGLWLTQKQEKLFENTSYWVEHTHEVLLETQHVLSLNKDVQIGGRGYVITGDSSFLEPVNQSADEILLTLERLKKLTADNPYQAVRFDSVLNLSKAMCAFVRGYIAIHNQNGMKAAADLLKGGEGKRLMNSIRHVLGRIERMEAALLKIRKEKNQQSVAGLYNTFWFLFGSEALFIIVIFLTVTQTVRARVKTYKQQALFEAIIHSSEDAIISKDLNGIITSWNRGAEKLFQYSAAEIIGKSVTVLIPPDKLGEEAVIMKKIHENMIVDAYDTERLRKDGSTFYVSLTVSPLKDAQGKIVGASKIGRDISHRKEQEGAILQQARLIDLSFDAIFAWDLQGGIIFWSQGATELYGYTREQSTGKISHELLQTFHPKGIEDVKRELVTWGSWTGELRHITREGFPIIVESRLRLAKEADGRQIVVETNRNITERKRAEEQLRASLKEVSDYKFAIDESAIVATTDQKGIIKYVNKNFCKISGYSESELLGQDHRIINSNYHPKEFIRRLWTTIANGGIWKGELRNRAKDGSLYWVDTTVVPFLNDQGKPYQYLAIRADITQRKEAEEVERLNEELREKLRSKSEELVEVFERITDGFIVLDRNFHYTYANKRVGEMIGRDSASMIGLNVWEEFPDAVGSGTYRAFHQALEENRYVYNLDYYPPLNLWQENHIYPSREGLSVFIRDVSMQKNAEASLKKSEKIYRTIASGIPGSVIFLLDRDFRYWLIEGDMLGPLGYSKDDLLGKKVNEILPAQRLSEILPLFERAFSGETFTMETTRNNLDVISRYVPLRDEEDNVFSLMIVTFDITELKKAQRAVSELNAGLEIKIAERTMELNALNKELESFSYSVAHDLRTPLRGIDGYVTMLNEDYSAKLDAEGNRLMTEVLYNTRRMGKLIDDLLAFSRLGRKEIQQSVIDITEIVEDCIQEIAPGDENHKKFIFGTLHPALADPSLIRHAIINLLSNAVKYSSKNQNPRIEVSSAIKGNEVVYSVKDNGVGFDMEYADKLFGVFQRLHSDEEFEGTGVGLAIVQRVVHRHGGRVWAESKVDQGATFCFSLPASPATITKKKRTK